MTFLTNCSMEYLHEVRQSRLFAVSLMICILLLSAKIADAQTWTCYTETSGSAAKYGSGSSCSYPYTPTNVSYKVRIFVHVVRRTDGTGGLTSSQVTNAINKMESDFQSAGITFDQIGSGEVRSDYYYNFDNSKFTGLIGQNPHDDAVDIYLLPVGNYGGRASGIPGKALVLDGQYAGTSVLSHEMGHALGLFHTHSGRGCGDFANCQEAVDGSNCCECGDLVCDTPADPCLSGRVNTSCQYIGPSGFNPDIGNIMAYTLPSCMTHFTNEQYSRALSETVNKLQDVLSELTASTNLTISSGQTWSLKNATVKLASGKRIYVYGTLNADNTTFTASGSAWSGIVFNSGSTGTIDGSTLQATSGYAAVQISSASPTLSYSTISSNTIGISVSGSSSSPSIHHNTITSGSYGLRFYDAGGNVYNNTITNTSQASTAVITSVYADPYLSSSGSAAGHNKIHGFWQGLWAETAATIWTGSGTNCIYNNTSYDAFAMDGGVIYAENNWWGGGAPYVDTDETGIVDYTPYLTGGSCPASGASKMQQVVSSDASSAAEDLQGQLLAAKWKAVEGQYAAAARLFKAIVEAAPSSQEAGVALVELGRLARQRGDAALASYLSGQVSAGHTHRATVLGVLIGYHRARSEEAAALALATALEQEYPGTWQAFYGQWQMFQMHLEAGHYTDASQVLERMEPTREAEAYELALARERLAEVAGVHFAEGPPEAPAKQGSPEAGVEVAVYPNPFNPATTIRYELVLRQGSSAG
ncbi:right-handed parallel beta-helix repeat-containing protein [Rhodocaloribacter litoris]|uniref:right-handed parallel beta-helix repeat-containing protein n=1 Tax=Rhodocaloribacter litoris TaxID=2558931 RepID=UPI001E4CA796|nr:right-handed parallel beta-helix repeat-containing protein [Rhodocaloribacter litoris]QXD14406.1 right-handed parallel beta-helix repeat-containing protein [Rhodocaloribacter litoris]